jgi:hypothetical protein
MEDNLWAGYDLKRLKVRKLGSSRKSFGDTSPHPETMNEGFTVSDKSAAE